MEESVCILLADDERRKVSRVRLIVCDARGEARVAPQRIDRSSGRQLASEKSIALVQNVVAYLNAVAWLTARVGVTARRILRRKNCFIASGRDEPVATRGVLPSLQIRLRVEFAR